MDESKLLSFETTADPTGLRFIDRVEQLQYELYTPDAVAPRTVPPDSFLFPVDEGLRIRTEELVLPSVVPVIVRDRSGTMLSEIEHLESESFEEGAYILELSTQVKTFVEFEGPVTISVDLLQVRFEFDGATTLDLGLRSRHTRPAATITTPADPRDVMKAVSTFGSALKSTSPERSFPTLRGHPPEVELGSSFEVPDGLETPETGIHLEVPPVYGAIYPVAPLAYYLGADVRPGQTPRLTTDDGFEYAFDYPDGFEDDVARTLKQVFLLDCVTRTEGFYEIDLRQRTALDRHLDLDWPRLYERPIADRMEPYLSVPYELLDEHVPEWRLTAHVEPNSETVEQLPFVVDDLAIVRTAQTPESRSSSQPARQAVTGDTITRSASESSGARLTRATAGMSEEATFVEPQSTDSLEHAWIGDHIPIGASKLTTEAFQNRLDRERTAGDISISIVLNDPRMEEERQLVDDVYGDRDDLPFDVALYHDLSVAELRERLQEDRSFLHYIGHIDEDGFECHDGKLDVGTLEETGIDAFLLNACNSYRQGLDLIGAGAIGGIVTLTEILNDRAVQIGGTVAKLLNTGYPLRAALTIAREENVLGGQYIVVGDGGMTVTQSQSRVPNLVEISSRDQGYAVDIRTFATDTAGLGTIFIPYIGTNTDYFLTSGRIGPFHVSKSQLIEFLELEEVPVRVDDADLTWSSSLSREQLQ